MIKNRIIDDINYLSSISPDELDNALLDPKYNKANLRELVRRSISYANEQKDLCAIKTKKYEKEKRKIDKINAFLNELERGIDDE